MEVSITTAANENFFSGFLLISLARMSMTYLNSGGVSPSSYTRMISGKR